MKICPLYDIQLRIIKKPQIGNRKCGTRAKKITALLRTVGSKSIHELCSKYRCEFLPVASPLLSPALPCKAKRQVYFNKVGVKCQAFI